MDFFLGMNRNGLVSEHKLGIRDSDFSPQHGELVEDFYGEDTVFYNFTHRDSVTLLKPTSPTMPDVVFRDHWSRDYGAFIQAHISNIYRKCQNMDFATHCDNHIDDGPALQQFLNFFEYLTTREITSNNEFYFDVSLEMSYNEIQSILSTSSVFSTVSSPGLLLLARRALNSLYTLIYEENDILVSDTGNFVVRYTDDDYEEFELDATTAHSFLTQNLLKEIVNA